LHLKLSSLHQEIRLVSIEFTNVEKNLREKCWTKYTNDVQIYEGHLTASKTKQTLNKFGGVAEW
jgi:hypothetical protein